MADAAQDPQPSTHASPASETPKSSSTTPPQPTPTTTEKPLPKLTPSEFRTYNSMADHMDYFHSHFRHTWNMLITTCDSNKRPSGMSIRQFLATIEQFISHLTMHHTIEERHIFPVLAKKMPAFRKELELLSQHKQIHEGLERLEEYVGACRRGEKELRLSELKGVLESFGGVLWEHLDDEVRELGAENMRKYWTVEEMRRMPM
ncbi:hypothetical protein M011DRAFT_492563 [Sporormia fimetaria CBS 119925]|uniref:Hemerythrin-like domain-containing protein n=1 Tax=Sporormia fimetaria CBS 119925 TaxID=1340428 RepID=A0A6A6VMF9_9PLEO|nr:hypothetical protein M011DRAFT_492563 [Sporormia fimetaria CBS 119925]